MLSNIKWLSVDLYTFKGSILKQTCGEHVELEMVLKPHQASLYLCQKLYFTVR